MSIQKWRKFMLGSLIAEEVSEKVYSNTTTNNQISKENPQNNQLNLPY